MRTDPGPQPLRPDLHHPVDRRLGLMVEPTWPPNAEPRARRSASRYCNLVSPQGGRNWKPRPTAQIAAVQFPNESDSCYSFNSFSPATPGHRLGKSAEARPRMPGQNGRCELPNIHIGVDLLRRNHHEVVPYAPQNDHEPMMSGGQRNCRRQADDGGGWTVRANRAGVHPG